MPRNASTNECSNYGFLLAPNDVQSLFVLIFISDCIICTKKKKKKEAAGKNVYVTMNYHDHDSIAHYYCTVMFVLCVCVCVCVRSMLLLSHPPCICSEVCPLYRIVLRGGVRGSRGGWWG